MAAPQPSPEQIAAMQQQLAAEAAKRGMTPEEFANMQRQQLAQEAAKHGLTPEQYLQQLRAQAMRQHQMQQQQQHQQQQMGEQGHEHHEGCDHDHDHDHNEEHQHHEGCNHDHDHGPPQQKRVPVSAGVEPDPKAIAIAKFLSSQNLKTRTCILDGRRRELFKVKRAIRALESPAYAKAASKPNSLLPPVTDRTSAENAFKLLPMSLLALRVSKVDQQKSSKQKRVKGLWTVRIEQHQDTDPMMHYAWLYEGPQWKQKAMAGGVLVLIMAVVMFPLWPIMLRQGVWYLSIGMMGLLGLFFAMAIFRLILFCVTFFAVPPGLWLYPNLFEDVGFFDSFRPVWGWQETKKKKKKAKKIEDGAAAVSSGKPTTASTEQTNDITPSATSTGAQPQINPGATTKRDLTASVEDAEEE